MKDGMDQEIHDGDIVIWVGGKTQYANVQLYRVTKITSKRVKIELIECGDTPHAQTKNPTVDPTAVVVVNKLLDNKYSSLGP